MEPKPSLRLSILKLALLLLLLVLGGTVAWAAADPAPAGHLPVLAQETPPATAFPTETLVVETPTVTETVTEELPITVTEAPTLEKQISAIVDKVVPILTWIGIGLAAFLAIMWLSLVIMTYQDIRLRSESLVVQLFSTLLVLLFFLPGYWVYLMLRPKETLAEVYARGLEREYIMQDIEERPVCPTCQRGAEPDFILCPYCHTPLKKKCPTCGRLMDLTWQICPYCGQ